MTDALTSDQRARERSIQLALTLDAGIMSICVAIAVFSGSLTLIAELVRSVLMFLIELFALLVMRRIHRGRVSLLEFGSGKLEQVVNLAIAGGMLLAAVWIAVGVVRLVTGAEVTGTPAGLALTAIATSTNVYLNAIAWDGMRRAAKAGGSLIMQGQLQARQVKLVSSAFVQVTLTIAALSTDVVVIAWADGVGALFVSGFIVYTAVGMLKAGLPDLIDQSVAEEYQAAINRMLVKHFEDFDRLNHVRTRRSGDTVYAEVAVAFPPHLAMAEVNGRIDAMKATLRTEVPGADLSILASSS